MILYFRKIINTIYFSNSNSYELLSYIFQLEYLETFDKNDFYSTPSFNNYMYKRLLPFGSVISFENIKNIIKILLFLSFKYPCSRNKRQTCFIWILL